MLLENLESDTRHGLIRVPSFTLAIRAFDDLAICLFEIDIKRLIVITETQVIHREPLIRGFHALGGNRQFKFLLLLCLNGKILTFQITLCFYGIESLCGNICAVCQMVSYGHHIFRRIPFSVLGHEFIFRALVMERYSVLIDVL